MLPSPTLSPIKWDRMIIVANRLPVTAKGAPPVFTPSSGGLVTGVTSLKSEIPSPPVWVGWPGVIPEEHVPSAQQQLKEMGFKPVILSEQLSDLFYDGFVLSFSLSLFIPFTHLISHFDNSSTTTTTTTGIAMEHCGQCFIRCQCILES